MNKLIKRSFLNTLGLITYIAVIATVLMNGEKVFGNVNPAFAPVAFLSLFVLSAALSASLVLGKPILMYLNGEKTEAIKLFFYTLAWLAIAIIAILAVSVI